jgi:hypothetical protein
MNILVTNDDGVDAPGLMSLAQAMLPFGNIQMGTTRSPLFSLISLPTMPWDRLKSGAWTLTFR